jgi:hypothetical protein
LRRGAGLIAAALSCGLAPGMAHAWFETSEPGPRARALGNAYVSVADDPTALAWNPAGLVQLRRQEVLAVLDQSPDLQDVASGWLGAALHAPWFSGGIGWQHVAVADLAREDVVTLGLARTVVRRSLGAFVAVGATLKIAHVGLETDAGSGAVPLRAGATGAAADAGVLLAPIPNITVGAVLRNLGEPRFDLVEGGTATALEREFECGASLRWREDGWLHLARIRRGDMARMRAGAEVRIASVLDVRAGVEGEAVSGGIGLGFGRWRLDSAWRSHSVLGVQHSIGLRCGFGKERTGVGGEFDSF